MNQDDRFAFTAEWYDPNASLFRRYELLYYPKDGSVEMYDVKNRRTFLKRTKYDSLHLEDLFVGNKITIFSRHLSLVDYGDQYTARKLGSRKEKKEAADFYVDHQSKPFYNELLQFITSGPIVAMEILGDDAVCKWKTLLGPANSAAAQTDAPDSIRANFGHDGIRNAAHGPDSVASAAQELELFFPSSGGRGPVSSAKFTNSTCCVIKPHAVNEGLAGKIIKAIISEGFQISALQMFNMERPNVEEFYEIYRDVVAEYMEMVTELCSGPCIAMEIIQPEPPKVFRDFCGPSDPEIARHLRPGTLRAVFGRNKVQNAVHCTDLPEDGPLEVQYFFRILEN
ncbi:nucleoside diphosphate kinase homolog 7 isoform 3-T3 [Porphyrio hochstetteri]